MPRPISAAVLAGGLGTRLKDVVPDKQKVMAEVAGKPFLGYILNQLRTHGFGHVVFCTGYHEEQIRSAFGTEWNGIELSYSHETEPLGTGGAIRLALEQLRGSHVLVLNGDSFCDTDVSLFVDSAITRGSAASMVLTTVDDTTRYGRVTLEHGNQIRCFHEKGLRGPGLINAGIYLIPRTMLEALPQEKTSLEQNVFPRWATEKALFGFQAQVDSFIDIGTPESYQEAGRLFADPATSGSKE